MSGTVLSERDWVRVDTAAAGNCLFESLVAALALEAGKPLPDAATWFDMGMELRHTTATVLNNDDAWAEFISYHPENLGPLNAGRPSSKRVYVNAMRRPGCFGGQFEVRALETALGRPIEIYTRTRGGYERVRRDHERGLAGSPLRLLYDRTRGFGGPVEGGHYEPLVFQPRECMFDAVARALLRERGEGDDRQAVARLGKTLRRQAATYIRAHHRNMARHIAHMPSDPRQALSNAVFDPDVKATVYANDLENSGCAAGPVEARALAGLMGRSVAVHTRRDTQTFGRGRQLHLVSHDDGSFSHAMVPPDKIVGFRPPGRNRSPGGRTSTGSLGSRSSNKSNRTFKSNFMNLT